MENFQLIPLFNINGIGAASGLVFKDNSLFIISDNSTFLYQFDIPQKKLTKISLVGNSQENILKKDKLDFEAITLKGNKLHIFGSGSTSKREKRITYNLETKTIKEKNLKKLYKNLKQTTQISDEDLNIEGALFYNENLFLLQRGNGENSKNGIFIINRNDNDNAIFTAIELPKLQNIEATFTDAIQVDDKIYFLAAVENTTSTYDDGEILGSFIGCLALDTLELEFTKKISNTHKFEGLTLYNKTETTIELLLCEDTDTEVLETVIYKLVIKKQSFQPLKGWKL